MSNNYEIPNAAARRALDSQSSSTMKEVAMSATKMGWIVFYEALNGERLWEWFDQRSAAEHFAGRQFENAVIIAGQRIRPTGVTP